MRILTLAILPLVLIPVSLAGQQEISESIATASTGTVEIFNVAGSVRVTGWDREQIQVTGTLGRGSERLDITGGRERTEIRVIVPRGTRNVRGSELVVRVPTGKSVSVRTTSADIRLSDLAGELTAHSTSGDVSVGGSPRSVVASSTSGDVVVAVGSSGRVRASTTSGDVEIRGTVQESVSVESVSGDVDVRASTPEVRAKTVSGNLALNGVSGRVSATTVSGDAVIRDSEIRYGAFETVSGNLRFDGTLPRGAAFSLQSHSGDVEMRLPAGIDAAFDIRTFSGDIATDFGQQAQRTSRHGPGRELRFTAGAGGGLVSLRTFSGNVKLLRR